MTKFRVAICGAGIGGLTTAVALSRYPDIEVEIFEGAKELAELGAGIGLWPRVWEIIQKLHLEEDLLKVTELSLSVTSFRYRKSDRPEGLDFYTLITKASAVVPDTLLEASPVVHPAARRACRLCSLKTGTQTTCDLLVGADGLKSAVRRTLLGEKARLAESKGLWSEAADITAYLGKNGYVIAYPIAHGTKINFVAFKAQHHLENTKFNGAWVGIADRSEFATMFRNWEPEVQALLDCVDKPLRWAIHTVKPLGSFVHGNVAILGDAAHAMTPHQGSGAGQAIEDAYILSTLLGHPATNRDTIARALSIYDHIRRPFAQQVQLRSRLNGQYFTFCGPEVDFNSVPEHELLNNLDHLGKAFTKNWDWCWTTSLGDSVKEAVRLLETS
ncbi:hypothetical protein NLJ89_g8235 [Agrocybe chaxingu]|uniref:FAD-binding domain-containing protein n=1 Tax=Agrocybe chaxingu TaxID=84603 RepID=A0A9W8JXT5_9AGAR|nr:hypothetical protein NLJ89_g8235 [Agrocybe chaxingu]